MVPVLEHGRECYGRRAWAAAYDALICADQARALEADVDRRKVTLRIRRHPDPRIRSFTIVRHRGSSIFAVDGSGVARVCRTTTLVCTNRRVPKGTYRYATIIEDVWGTSSPTFSRKVVIRVPRR